MLAYCRFGFDLLACNFTLNFIIPGSKQLKYPSNTTFFTVEEALRTAIHNYISVTKQIFSRTFPQNRRIYRSTEPAWTTNRKSMQLDLRERERHARTFTRVYPNSETAKATWMSRKKKAIIYMEDQEGIRENGRTYDSV